MFVCFLLADVHQHVPPELRQFVLHSSLHYVVRDLINLTKINAEPSLNSSANPIHLFYTMVFWIQSATKTRTDLRASYECDQFGYSQYSFYSKFHQLYRIWWYSSRSGFPIDLLRKKLTIHFNKSLNSEYERLTINQALSYANHFITHGYAIFLNLDIFFDQSLTALQHRSLLDRQIVLYLSRYEVDPSITTLGLQCSEKTYVRSHDTLIFQPPLNSTLLERFPSEMATWHIEVKIISELIQGKYIVRNPCKSIRIWHFHSSQIRHRLMLSKKYLSDHHLGQVLRYPEWLWTQLCTVLYLMVEE